MAEYILRINARSKNALPLVNFLKNLDYVELQEKKEKEVATLPKETLQALKEMKNGDVVVCKGIDDYKRKVGHA